jgi:hypothetical protein
MNPEYVEALFRLAQLASGENEFAQRMIKAAVADQSSVNLKYLASVYADMGNVPMTEALRKLATFY